MYEIGNTKRVGFLSTSLVTKSQFIGLLNDLYQGMRAQQVTKLER
ncbi:hypothetical protein bcere0029_22150 [Bacillus cereus AH1272]|nr:hypothetical protein bcere0029_22150 [Bacillus cereus AH1272]EEL93705.1 hypothetical protein bcere0030_22160 [Bacillus cereus AH1273]OSX93320.1 hypothetical protein BTJ45_02033 [Bacillus mycoides]